jgi:hypothetical protein
MVHDAHKKWLLDDSIDLQTHFLVSANSRVDNLKATYLKNVGSEISEEELEKLYDLIVTGNSICKNYQDFYHKPLPDNMHLLSPEQEIIVEIPNTEYSHNHYNTSADYYYHHLKVEHNSTLDFIGENHKHKHYLKGRLDALIADKDSNIYILEHKTYATKPRIQDLNSNFQFLAYTWMAKQLDIGNVVGIAYDGMQKKVTGNLKDLFYREILYRNSFELQEFEEFLTADSIEMALQTNFSKNVPFNNCWDCDYKLLCDTQSKGEDSDYIRDTFYKLRDRSRE